MWISESSPLIYAAIILLAVLMIIGVLALFAPELSGLLRALGPG